MARKQPAKESATGRKRGAAVGAVRTRATAKGSAGSGARGGEPMVVAAWSNTYGWHETPGNTTYGWSDQHGRIHSGRPPKGSLWSNGKPFQVERWDDQPPPSPSESGLQARVQAGADTGEPERADKPATGGQQTGGVPDAGGGDAAGEVRADPDDWWSYDARIVHRAKGFGITGAAGRWYARGYADGGAVENREAARRTRTAIGAALLIGAAAGAVLLAIAQRILGGWDS